MSSSPFAKSKSKSQPGLLRRPSFSLLDRLYDSSSASAAAAATAEPAPKDREKRTLKKNKFSSGRSILRGPGNSTSSRHTSPPSANNPADSLNDLTVARPSLARRNRPSSIFGSLKSLRTNDDDTPPATAASSKPPSIVWRDFSSPSDNYTDIGRNKNVLHHGEVQTHSGMFWKKKEYLVLTETHLVRFKNQAKAADTFHGVLYQSRPNNLKHTSSPSCGSTDNQSLHSETSGDKVAGIPLEQVVAVHRPEDNKHSHSIDVSFLDVDAIHGSTINLQFADAEELELWAKSIRAAANRARLADVDPIPARLAEYAARIVERHQDYDISQFRIYKVVKKASTKAASASSDDVGKVGAQVCFLAVGLHMVHLITLPKNLARFSSASLSDLNTTGSFGIMSMTAILVAGTDDSFSLTFRVPFQKCKVFHLASLASVEIAQRLRHVEHHLRPHWTQRPYLCEIPQVYRDQFFQDQDDCPERDGLEVFETTLVAYCVAYGVNSSNIRYMINENIEDQPRFELLESAYGAARPYNVLEILALMRALRYNDSFASISFANTSLNGLNGHADRYGTEHVCTHTARGVPIRLSVEEQTEASLLVQEIRALAVSSNRLRRLDFSNCITTHAPGGPESAVRKLKQSGCGIVEALFPLCKNQATNIDWICLNGIELQEVDLDYLVSIAAEKKCHFRAIEASKCGLTDRGMALLLDVFRAHENTLEALDISNNPLRLVPNVLSRQLQPFGYIRRLDLSSLAVANSQEPLLPPEALLSWRLESLHLKGLTLNKATVEAICAYLSQPQSEVLRELNLSHCSLGGGEVASIMESMTMEPGHVRLLHLDVSENHLQKRHRLMTEAIRGDLAPTHFSMRSTEYDKEEYYAELLHALAENKSIRYLDVSKISLPCEISDETSDALHELFAKNQTLEDIDISGEDSRLETCKLGSGLNYGLSGLQENNHLLVLRVQFQKLGLHGASTIAEILKTNNTLRQVHCDNNAITLTGFTDIVNAVAVNTTMSYVSSLQESRDAALRETEIQIKNARSKADSWAMSNSTSKLSSMKRTFSPLAGSSTNRAPPRLAAVPQWTDQDIQAALRLVSEGWDNQCIRLQQYLDRNWLMSQGLADTSAPSSEATYQDVQRPGTAGSIGKVLERVASESTPTFEKQTQLGDVLALPQLPKLTTTLYHENEVSSDGSSTSLENPDLLNDMHAVLSYHEHGAVEPTSANSDESESFIMMKHQIANRSQTGLGILDTAKGPDYFADALEEQQVGA